MALCRNIHIDVLQKLLQNISDAVIFTELWAFLALLDFDSKATVVAQASVIRPSVNSGFSETTAQIQATLYGKALFAISPDRLLFFIQKFYGFFLFSLTWDHIRAKISKHYFSHSFGLISTKRYDKYVTHGGIVGSWRRMQSRQPT